MENQYWIGRKRLAMARAAAASHARLINDELAGRHGIDAAQCLPAALSATQARSEGRRAVLHLRDPASAPSAPMTLPPLDPRTRRDPDGFTGRSR